MNGKVVKCHHLNAGKRSRQKEGGPDLKDGIGKLCAGQTSATELPRVFLRPKDSNSLLKAGLELPMGSVRDQKRFCNLLGYSDKPECWNRVSLGWAQQGDFEALNPADALETDIFREFGLGATNGL